MTRIVIVILVVVVASCGKMFKGGEPDQTVEPLPVPVVSEIVKLRRAWSYDIGAGQQGGRFHLVPAVAQETVYAADPRGRVSAVDIQTGKQRWSVNLDAPVSGGVGVGDGLVLVGTLKGQVYALDAVTGEQLWTQQVSSEVLTPPVSASGIAVVRSLDGRLYGLSAIDGEPKWSFRRSVPSLTLRGAGMPAVFDNVVLSGFASGKILAADLETGRILWDVNVAQPRGRNEIERLIDIDARPLLIGSVMYIAAYQGQVKAFALGSRRILWGQDISSYNDLAADDNNIYVSDDQGLIHSLDRLTGVTVWKQESLQRRRPTAAAVLDDYVVVGDYEGYIYVVNKTDGQLAGRTKLGGGAVVGMPIGHDDDVLALTQGGTLTLLRLVQ